MEEAPAPEQLAPSTRLFLEDVEATESLGATLAHMAQRGDVFFLKGELGVGKTSFARGFLREFFGNPELDVPSPSYLLQFTYCDSGSSRASAPASAGPSATPAGPAAAAASAGAPADGEKATGHTFCTGSSSLVPGCAVYHVDPFRLPEGKIAALLDFEEVFAAVSLVEWPERLGPQLVSADSPPRLEVSFEGFGPQAQGRSVVFTGIGKRWRELVESWSLGRGPLCRPAEAPAPGEAAALQTATVPTLRDTDSAASTQRRPGGLGARQVDQDPQLWRVLGIESSCDDTGAAVLDGTGRILGEALASQAGIHEQWGGVVPRLAQEAHRGAIDATVEEALQRAGLKAEELTAVAVTVGPGLGLCLEVGVRKALQIAARHRLPLVRVHHMEAHAMVAKLPAQAPAADAAEAAAGPAFPFLTLLVSGGHNLAVLTHSLGHHRILGSTIDDSIGEAFDKTARILGITQIPGGPHLERLARDGDEAVYDTSLPKPLSKTRDPVLQKGCDFSFSGLKTAVRQLIDRELPAAKMAESSEADLKQTRANVAAAFQHVAVEHLCRRAERAAEWARELEPELKWLIVAGGVAANQVVRAGLKEVAESAGLEMRCPPPRLCVDNGVMVAWAGIERLRLGLYEVPPSESGVEHAVEIRPRWPIGERDARCQPQKLPRGQKRRFAGAQPPGTADGPAAKAAKA